MAKVIIKLRVLPSSPDTDLKKLEKDCSAKILALAGKIHSVESRPVAFSLASLVFTLFFEEVEGLTDKLEAALKELPEVSSVDIIDIRRAFG